MTITQPSGHVTRKGTIFWRPRRRGKEGKEGYRWALIFIVPIQIGILIAGIMSTPFLSTTSYAKC
jgi:hypothetical protein